MACLCREGVSFRAIAEDGQVQDVAIGVGKHAK